MEKKSRTKDGHHHPSRADRRRRGRNIGLWVLGIAALVFIFYLIDRSGPLETVNGVVVETRSYTHSGGDRSGAHTHVEAVLEFEDHRYTLQPGDRFAEGQLIQVEVHRGRITGYPYFVQAGRRR